VCIGIWGRGLHGTSTDGATGLHEITQHKITPLVCIVVLAVAMADSFTYIPNSFANAKLRIVLDSPEIRRLLLEQGTLDKASDALKVQLLKEGDSGAVVVSETNENRFTSKRK
jgi:hypothetical protein